MLRYLIAAASLLVPTTGASAQNAPSWTGFYAGGHLAGSRDRLHATDTLGISQISGLFVTGRGIIIVPNTTRDLDASGHKTNFDWGGQIGYQWQTGHVVLGLEGDFDPSHRNIAASQSLSLPVTALTPSVSIETSRRAAVKYSWSIRGRVGYAFGGTLAYATGGYASARMHFRADNILTNPGGPAAPCTPNCTANLGPEGPNDSFEGSMYANRGGWTGGLGVEQRLMRHLSIGLEYRHTDFGDYDLGPVASGTLFTGPFTHGSDGGTGQHLTVYDSGSRRRLSSDSIGLRANFRF